MKNTVLTLDGITGEGQNIVSFAFEGFSTISVFSLFENGKNEMFHYYRTREPTRQPQHIRDFGPLKGLCCGTCVNDFFT